MRRISIRTAVAGVAALLALPLLVLLAVQAQARQPYDANTFEEAQAAGKTILVHVHASWCPTCRRQEPIVERLEKQRPEMLVYVVDFDRDKAALKRFAVTTQATLILFKGAQEVGRVVYDADAGRIAALVEKGF
jgi:thiol-disulfide isomerase/thioredoxin